MLFSAHLKALSFIVARILVLVFFVPAGFLHCVKMDCVSTDLTCAPAIFALRPTGISFNPAPGYYTTAQSISISSILADGTIFFTTDGSVPTASSTMYTSPLPIWSAAGKTIRAYARTGGGDTDAKSARYSYHTMRTGQVVSYATNDDAALSKGVPVSFATATAHSVYTGDYTTLDNSTGLVWKSCSEGQSGPTCGTGGVSALTLNQATTACSALNTLNGGNGYAGIKNWRLPTMRELTTLTDFSRATLSVYTASFPGTANYAYWSSTVYPPNPWVAPNGGFGWYVDYTAGDSYAAAVTGGYHARCVSAPVLAETESFADLSDGTIQDNVTGLIWQKCTTGQANDASCSGTTSPASSWSAALTYCSGLTLAGRSWRLPNRNELGTLHDYTVASGTKINLTMFPNTPAAYYWTSTTRASATTSAWWINFGTGFNALSDTLTKADAATNVRCVTNP